MHTKNKIIALTCGIALLATSSFSFANDSTTTTGSSTSTTTLDSNFIAPIPGATKLEPYAGIWGFIKKNTLFTEEEYKTMMSIFVYYTKQVKEVQANTSLTKEEYSAKIYEINKAFFTALKPYIDSTKMADYEKWVTQKLSNTGTTSPTEPKPVPTPAPVPSTGCVSQDNGSNTNVEIKLSAKIAKPYMVSLEWSDYFEKGEENLLGYKIVIKNTSGEEKVVSVDSDTTEKDDWSSKAGMNVYKVYAITSDGVKHESNSVNIPMNGNGGYDFSLVNPVCKPKPNNNKKPGDLTDTNKIVNDALKIGPNIVKKIKFQYKLLSEKTRQLVNSKIDSITKEKRAEYLKNLLTKIDKLIKVTKSSSLIAKLEELKQVIQERLDEITGTSADDSIINDLLNDTTTDTSSDNSPSSSDSTK